MQEQLSRTQLPREIPEKPTNFIFEFKNLKKVKDKIIVFVDGYEVAHSFSMILETPVNFKTCLSISFSPGLKT